MQRDPNQSGMALLSSSMHGRGGFAVALAFGMEGMYGDGANLYAYVASNPWMRNDPLGLWFADLTILAAEAAIRGLGGGLGSMIGEYSDNMEFNIEWAMDWTLPNDWNTRSDNSWVGSSFREGLEAGLRDTFLDYVDPLGVRNLFSTGSRASNVRTLYRFSGAGAKATRALRAITRGRLHHVWPKYLARITGTQSTILARLPHGLHTKYHRFISHGMHNGSLGTPYMNARRIKWTQWINKQRGAGVSDLQTFNALGTDLIRLTRQFERTEGITGLTDAIREALVLAP